MTPKETGVIEIDPEPANDDAAPDEATAREVAEQGFKPIDINLSPLEQALNNEAQATPSDCKMSEEQHDRLKHYAKVGERRVRSVVTLVLASEDANTLATAIKESAAGKVKGGPKALTDPILINGSASSSPPIVCFSVCFAMQRFVVTAHCLLFYVLCYVLFL